MAILNGKGYKREELLKFCGNIEQIASITKATLTNGIKTVSVKTGGGLEYTILPSRCLDIASLSFKGVNISFLSKNGIVYQNDNNFLHYMAGGMLFTCGLKNVGSSCEEKGEMHPTHGRIGITPAQNFYARGYWKNDDYILEAYGEMKETALFGSNLVLKRKITSKLGENSITIMDELENNSPYEEEFMFLYHFNFGFPFLDEDTKIIFPQNHCVARDEKAQKGINEIVNIDLPKDSYHEQVFFCNLKPDEDGMVRIEIINKRLGIKAVLEYEKENLPNFTQWKSLKSTDYALGLEPCNCSVFGRVLEKGNGTIKKLKPFEKKSFNLNLILSDL